MNFILFISLRNNVTTSLKYFDFFFLNLSFTCEDVYILPRIVITNTRLCVFQYKVLNNALYLNKHLYIFKLRDINLFFFNQQDETISHLFANYLKS